MRVRALLIATSLLLCTSNVLAEEIVTGCVKAVMGGFICPIEPLGTLVLDVTGRTKCAPGMCIKDAIGNAICAARPGGRAFKDVVGTPLCQGGCIVPSPRLWEKLG